MNKSGKLSNITSKLKPNKAGKLKSGAACRLNQLRLTLFTVLAFFIIIGCNKKSDSSSSSPTKATPGSDVLSMRAMAVSPDGNWLFVSSNSEGKIRSYKVDASGYVTLSSSFTTTAITHLAVTSNNKFLIQMQTTQHSHPYVHVYEINSTTGELTLVSTYNDLMGYDMNMVLNPDGFSVTIAMVGPYRFTTLKIDSSTGVISFWGESDSTQSGPLPTPTVLKWNPAGTFLYAYMWHTDTPYDHNIATYKLETNGTLTALSTVNLVNSNQQFGGFSISPDGKFLYAATHDSDLIYIFTINVNGSLTSGGTVTMTVPGQTKKAPTVFDFMFSQNGGHLIAHLPCYHVFKVLSINGTTGALTEVGTYNTSALGGYTPTTFQQSVSGTRYYSLSSWLNEKIYDGVTGALKRNDIGSYLFTYTVNNNNGFTSLKQFFKIQQ